MASLRSAWRAGAEVGEEVVGEAWLAFERTSGWWFANDLNSTRDTNVKSDFGCCSSVWLLLVWLLLVCRRLKCKRCKHAANTLHSFAQERSCTIVKSHTRLEGSSFTCEVSEIRCVLCNCQVFSAGRMRVLLIHQQRLKFPQCCTNNTWVLLVTLKQ